VFFTGAAITWFLDCSPRGPTGPAVKWDKKILFGVTFMTRNKLFLSFLSVTALICGGALFAQTPATNIDPNKHRNLAEAQHFIQQAYDKEKEAQKANKEKLGGHAEKAKQHLDSQK
jgi:hypothetical protein